LIILDFGYVKQRKQEGYMFKKTLFVLLSILIISGVCFAGEEVAEPVEEATEAVAEESTEAAAEESAEEAVEESTLSLEDIQMCSGVEDRQPTGTGTVFSDDLDKIYCFTKVVGAADPTSVNHVWYMGDKQIVSVNLPIKAESWRTWSSKMLDMGLGKGHVEIVTEGGDLLGKAEFEIKAAAEEAEEAEEVMEEEVEEPAEEKAPEAAEEE
jgi:hypothetical protein